MKIDITNKDDLINFAKDVAGKIEIGKPILLFGNLGVGKTFFTTYLIRNLVGSSIRVPSPTFSLLQNYTCDKGNISHYDFYRINDASELYELDIDNSLENNITIIEWPEIMMDYIRKNYETLELYFSFENGKREVSF